MSKPKTHTTEYVKRLKAEIASLKFIVSILEEDLENAEAIIDEMHITLTGEPR